jgi:hypothetical protein
VRGRVASGWLYPAGPKVRALYLLLEIWRESPTVLDGGTRKRRRDRVGDVARHVEDIGNRHHVLLVVRGCLVATPLTYSLVATNGLTAQSKPRQEDS